MSLQLPLRLIMTTDKRESPSIFVESKTMFWPLCLPLRVLHESCPIAPRWTEFSALPSLCITTPADPASQLSTFSSFGAWAHTILSWNAWPLSLLSQMFVKWKTNSPFPRIRPSLSHFEIWSCEKSKKLCPHCQLTHGSVTNRARGGLFSPASRVCT